MERRRAGLAMGITIVAWAAAFPAIRVAVADLGPGRLTVVRLTAASVALGVVAAVVGIRRPARSDLPRIAVSGATGMTAYQLLLNAGEVSVPAGTASMLIATAPLHAIVLARWVLGERVRRRQWAGTLIGLAGAVVIALARSGSVAIGGDALAVLAAAVSFGAYSVAQQPLLTRYTGLEVVAYVTWAGTAFSLPWALQPGPPQPDAPVAAVIAAVVLGIIPSALGFVLWAYALARLGVARVTVGIYLVPVVAVAVAFVWLGERPHPLELLGGAVALYGVILAGRRRPATEPAGPDPREAPAAP